MRSPSAAACSKLTTPSRYSSSRARNRPTTTSVLGASAVSARNVATPAPAQPLDQDRRLLAHADRRGMDVLDDTPGSGGLGANAASAIAANSLRAMPSSTSGSSSASHGSRAASRGRRGAGRRPASRRGQRGDLLERAVLQQPGEQQVPGLQQRQVLLVLDRAVGQQPGGLEVQQGGGDDQERGGLVQVPVRALGAHVRDEVVGDHVQRELGDLDPVLGDQAQQQVERPLEAAHPDGERRVPALVDAGAGRRSPARLALDRGGGRATASWVITAPKGRPAPAALRLDRLRGHPPRPPRPTRGSASTWTLPGSIRASTSRASCR